jgi:hypothetical protein
MMVQKLKKKRKCWTLPKGKGKENVFDEPSSSKPKTKGNFVPSPDEECFHWHKKGRWFRNYKKYLEELKKKKGSETYTSCINVIEINIAISSSDSQICDTRSMIHTCKSLQGLSETRRHAISELDVRVTNGAKVAAIAGNTYLLPLPLGLVLELNNCYCILGIEPPKKWGVHQPGSDWVILDETRIQWTHINIQYHILILSKIITH